MLNKAKAPEVNREEILQSERKFVDENFTKLIYLQRHYKKRKFAFALAGVIITFFIVFGSAAFNGYVKGTPPFLSIFGKYIYFAREYDTVVARVNGEPIYLSNVANEYFLKMESYEFHRKYYGDKYFETPPDPVKTLNGLINKRLIEQYMKKKGFSLIDKNHDIASTFSSQKEWFDYEVQGDVPDGIHLNPIEHKYFKEKSKIIQDAVNHSNLTRDEFFNKIIVPELIADEYARICKENIIENISVPEPTDKEINHYIKMHGKGSVTFAKLELASKTEAEKIVSLFEKQKSSCFALLNKLLAKNTKNTLTKLSFKHKEELPEYVVKSLKAEEFPYFSEVKVGSKYYIICIFDYQPPRQIPQEEAIYLIKLSKKKVIASKKIAQLEQELYKKANIQIINRKAVEHLADMH